jgi:hypothetical protein
MLRNWKTANLIARTDSYQEFARQLGENNNVEAFEKQLDEFFRAAKVKEIEPLKHLDQLLESSFIVAEGHDDPLPKLFLMRNMLKLKEAGFTTLFIEHLYYDDQQGLDDYCASRMSSASKKIETYLAVLDRRNFGLGLWGVTTYFWRRGNFSALAHMAKLVGIRIVAIDIEFSYTQQLDKKHNQYIPGVRSAQPLDNFRNKSMNYTAYKIMCKEMKNAGEKFIALLGSHHAKTHEGIMGLSELMGVRTVLVEFNPGLSQLEVTFNAEFEGKQLEVVIKNGTSFKPVWTDSAIPILPYLSPALLKKATVMEGYGTRLHSGPVRLWSFNNSKSPAVDEVPANHLLLRQSRSN